MGNEENQQVGHLILKEDGSILESGGELQNDEQTANILLSIIKTSDCIDDQFLPTNSCERMSIAFNNAIYTLCLSNRRVYIKKSLNTKPHRELEMPHSNASLQY